MQKIANVAGDSVLIIDPASNAAVVSNVDVTIKLKDGKVQSKEIKGVLSATKNYGVSEEFMQKFAPQYNTVEQFVSKKIGTFTEDISTRPAFSVRRLSLISFTRCNSIFPVQTSRWLLLYH